METFFSSLSYHRFFDIDPFHHSQSFGLYACHLFTSILLPAARLKYQNSDLTKLHSCLRLFYDFSFTSGIQTKLCNCIQNWILYNSFFSHFLSCIVCACSENAISQLCSNWNVRIHLPSPQLSICHHLLQVFSASIKL